MGRKEIPLEIHDRSIEDILNEEKARLEVLQKGIDDVTFGSSETGVGGELTVVDNHPADNGTLTHGRELDLTIRRMLQGREDELNKALEKVHEGTYGICENC